MGENTIKTRIQLKNDTEEHWKLATNFTPKNGEMIIYDSDTEYSASRAKVGDGNTKVNDLDWLVEPILQEAQTTNEALIEITGHGEYIRDLVISLPTLTTGTYKDVYVQCCGKNLLDLSQLISFTDHGLVYSYDPVDKNYQAKGAVTGRVASTIGIGMNNTVGRIYIKQWLPAGHTYTFSCSTSPANFFSTLSCELELADGTIQTVTNGSSFTLTQNAQVLDIITNSVVYRANTEYEIIFYPMIELGSTATEYAPYCGQTYKYELGLQVPNCTGGIIKPMQGLFINNDKQYDIPRAFFQIQTDSNFLFCSHGSITNYQLSWQTPIGKQLGEQTQRLNSAKPNGRYVREYNNIIAPSTASIDVQSFYLLKINALSATILPWTIKYRLTVHILNTVTYKTGIYEGVFSRSGGTDLISSIYSVFQSTSYRPIYYTMVLPPKDTSAQSPFLFGFSLQSAYGPNVYPRFVKLEILEHENCEIEFLEDVVRQDQLNTTIYDAADRINISCQTRGYTITGDKDTTVTYALYKAPGSFINDQYYTCYRYKLLVQTDEDSLSPLDGSNNVTTATKTLDTDLKFNPLGNFYYYYYTSTVNKSAAFNRAYLYIQYNMPIDYSFNITTSHLPLTANLPVYLKVILANDGYCTLASADPLVQALPTQYDGFLYIYLGQAADATHCGLSITHPVWYHNGEHIVQYTGTMEMARPAIPTAPSSDGTYNLKVVVTDGVPVYSWELA